MTKMSLLLATIAALLLGKADLARAQTACPSTDRLSFININDGSVVNTTTLSNKTARIYIAAIPFLGGSTINAAFIWLNGGSCKAHWLSYDGVNIAPTLTKNTNLCMGSLNDVVDNIAFTHGQPLSCGGQSYTLLPMLYNGYRLDTYAGSGNDEVWGAGGVDRIYGGNGSDELDSGGPANERIYGEADNDFLFCPSSDNSHCSGSSGADEIQDLGGSSDLINGGSSNDEIKSCGGSTTVDCGAGDQDSLFHLSPQGTVHSSCESATGIGPVCPFTPAH